MLNFKNLPFDVYFVVCFMLALCESAVSKLFLLRPLMT